MADEKAPAIPSIVIDENAQSVPSIPLGSLPSLSMAVVPLKSQPIGKTVLESKPPPRALAVFIIGIAGMALWLGLAVGLPVWSGTDAIVSVVLLTFLLVPPSLFAARWGHVRGMLAITVSENGLVRRDVKGTAKLGWGEIAGVFERAWVHDSGFGKELRGSFTFVGRDQRIVIDSELSEWIELGRAARELAEIELFNAYERATDEKRALPFGKLILDPKGVETPDGKFPWSEISTLKLERNGLDAWWLVLRGGYFSVSKIPTHEVANCRLLVGVLNRIGKLDGIEMAVRQELEAIIDSTKVE